MITDKKHKIILFDGLCNYCNNTVNRVIDKDKKDIFRFTPLQSAVGMVMVTELGIDTSKVDSIILIEGSNYYSRSTAVLKIARDLSGLYPLLYGLIIIPNFIRNWVYDFIARNRYRWFGKRDQCMMPTAALKKRFL